MEFVFVVPRTALFPDCYPHGLAAFGPAGLGQRPPAAGESSGAPTLAGFETAVARDGFFVERAYAERTPSLKQVIPYSIIVCDERVLLFQRLATGGEKRLHGKMSIGIGGHINPQDLEEHGHHDTGRSPSDTKSSRSPIAAGTRREIAEELDVRGNFTVQSVGLLNDDSNPVGAVHVGVVQVVYVDGSVEIRERDQLEGRLVACEELQTLLARGANFETWSKLLVPRLDELLKLPLSARCVADAVVPDTVVADERVPANQGSLTA
jgi:predicted NUDIX family phosphoesterase